MTKSAGKVSLFTESAVSNLPVPVRHMRDAVEHENNYKPESGSNPINRLLIPSGLIPLLCTILL